MFYDDELNVNTQMVSLMRTIRATQERLGVEWRLRGFVKAQLFTDQQATESMGQSGALPARILRQSESDRRVQA